MTTPTLRIAPFKPAHLDAIVELSVRAWAPVFPAMKAEVPGYVYDAFYPDGWEARQRADVAAVCEDDETDVRVALLDDTPVGYVGLRAHEEDSMGEIHIIAVDPGFQRKGIGRALLHFAFDWMREKGLSIAMVESGGDGGHSPSRATYEQAGFERMPVARYFRKL